MEDCCREKLTESQLKKLLKKGKIGLIKGFKSTKGSTFDAHLVFKNGEVKFEYPPRK